MTDYLLTDYLFLFCIGIPQAELETMLVPAAGEEGGSSAESGNLLYEFYDLSVFEVFCFIHSTR